MWRCGRAKKQGKKEILNRQDYLCRRIHRHGQRAQKGRQWFIVARQKLKYQFHNPNTAETTADYILKVFMEVNEKKVERAILEVAGTKAPEKR